MNNTDRRVALGSSWKMYWKNVLETYMVAHTSLQLLILNRFMK